jgi:hypothetical protein
LSFHRFENPTVLHVKIGEGGKLVPDLLGTTFLLSKVSRYLGLAPKIVMLENKTKNIKAHATKISFLQNDLDFINGWWELL